MDNPLKGLINWRRKRVLIFVLLFFICFGDSMVARTYHAYLCHTEAGTYTYHQIELDDSYWNEDGSPKFYNDKNGFDHSFFADGRFKLILTSKKTKISSVGIASQKFTDTSKGIVLVEILSPVFTGGWFVNNMQPFTVGVKRCNVKSLNYHQSDNSILFSSSFEDVVKRAFIREVN